MVRGAAKQGPKHLGDIGNGSVKTAAETRGSEIQPGYLCRGMGSVAVGIREETVMG